MIRLALLLSLIPGAAVAQTRYCQPIEILTAELHQHFGQTMTILAMQPMGSLLMFFVAEDGRYSVVVQEPGKMACAIAGGTAFQIIITPPGIPG
jgi:hypothetical protein